MIGRARLRRQGLTLPNWLGLRVLLIDPLHGMREARIVRDASLPAPVTREVLAELRIRGWAVIDQPDGPYRLTTSGLERAQDAARAVDTPWKLSCRIRGRCNRARARARAHDFAVADALTIALDLARRLADTYVSSPARSKRDTTDSTAINRAVERASLLDAAFDGFDPDAYRSVTRGRSGYDARKRRRCSAEDPSEIFETPAIDPPSPLTQPIRAVARAIVSGVDFRRTTAAARGFDLFRARRRSFLRLVELLRPTYVRLDAIDGHNDQTLGDLDELIQALRSTRDLYLAPRAQATTAGRD